MSRFVNDMFVEFGYPQDTVSRVKNIEQYITNELVHDGTEEDPGLIIERSFQTFETTIRLTLVIIHLSIHEKKRMFMISNEHIFLLASVYGARNV